MSGGIFFPTGSGGGGGTGDVDGPGASTDNAIVRFDGVTGKLLQNSTAILNDAGELALTSTGVGTSALTVVANSVVSGKILDVTANSLGGGGQFFRFYTTAGGGGGRVLGEIRSDNVAASNITMLRLNNSGAGTGLEIFNNGEGQGISMSSGAQAADALTVDASSLTTGSTAKFSSDSVDVGARSVLHVVNSNVLAVNAVGAFIEQASTADGLAISATGNATAFRSTSAATTSTANQINAASLTTGTALFINADALTTGSAFSVLSNSAGIGTRTVARIVNDNAAASGATALYVQQDAAQNSIDLAGTGGGSIRYQEVAAVPVAPGAGKGTTWVKNTTASSLVFTDDTGIDKNITRPDYSFAFKTTDQDNVTAGTDITFDTNVSRGVTFASPSFTLQANKTYTLRASFGFDIDAAESAVIEWVDSTNTPLANSSSFEAGNNTATTLDFFTGYAFAVRTTGGATETVKLRVTSVVGTGGDVFNGIAEVQEIF